MDELYGRGPDGDLLSYSGGGATSLAGLNRHRDLAFGFDPQGSLSLTRVYEPFGDIAGETGTASPALGFQGDYTDPASGQVWMGARWYEPGTASFLTRDTVLGDLSSPVSLNRYTYGFADPLEYLDPDGRFGFSLSGFFSGVSRFFSGLWRGATSFASRAPSFVSRTAWGVSSAVSSAGRAVARWGSGIVRSTASAVAQVAPPIRSATAMAAKVFAKGLGGLARGMGSRLRGPEAPRGIPLPHTATPATASGEQGGEQGLLGHIGGFVKGLAGGVGDTVKGVATLGGNVAKWGFQCATLQEGCVRGVQAAGRVASQMIRHPVATAKAIVAPAIDAIRRGRPGEAAGWLSGALATTLGTGAALKGAGAAARVAKARVGQAARGLRKIGDDIADAGRVGPGRLREGVRRLVAEETGAIRVSETRSLASNLRRGGGPEIVERAMSRAELQATRATGLVRGGAGGTHYVSDAVNHNALRAQQRLSLPRTPEVRVRMEVPEGVFSAPKRVDPAFGMPGGGLERTAFGPVPCRILCAWDY